MSNTAQCPPVEGEKLCFFVAVCQYAQTEDAYALDEEGLSWTRKLPEAHRFALREKAGEVASKQAEASKGEPAVKEVPLRWSPLFSSHGHERKTHLSVEYSSRALCGETERRPRLMWNQGLPYENMRDFLLDSEGHGCKRCLRIFHRTHPLAVGVSDVEALAMCDSIRACDDRIGRYSDHEGNEGGPTYYFWTEGKTSFEEHALRAIYDHQLALRAWRKALKLNDRR